ncbi:hypothetical protein PH210_05705 [Paenibacillus sp. BSR1-1]|uniref:hypothetical protein n=1 Tax=Paenibacillus sp. BSR1-1 TaxID=3020845 RepID=UPI0025B21C56|nr:hypothetical protein [Paenibacillus sp. BSR1-1]MDN3015703.1 hypothetical protein [Paenibacillus sp. BSR1-1]
MKKVIIVIFSLYLLVGFSDSNVRQSKKLEESIHTVVENKSKSEIDITSLANFTWDKAFIFPPYTTQESIDEQLDVHFKDPSDIDKRDDIYLLVFLNKGKVLQYAEIKRQKSVFSVGEKKFLSPSSATISIVRK